MTLYCIKKNQHFLAYRDQFDDCHNWQMSDLDLALASPWYWTTDKNVAKIFITQTEAEVFLNTYYGESFIQAEINLYRYEYDEL
ncbi:hypothetical protein GCM10023345_15890 [Acinetobacter kookii]|uniref:Uncharacterized protein n=1 Tax=Acinetobacter kookii TaxID=1226327 RepID=A0A1G6GL28_9GAMM|nr:MULTISPECIES: hypothetical protein [Acinetobacter]MCT8088311.1 hypothetical protein [Acinetobacter sp. F_3_1]MCT8097680.1 hypothetical protein [Acinetobacter sp. C_3_1]MCT8100336.1 hypothetical protein [Acinetobacter sp. C_4_1]MCT8133945.1 hypothetical protein [Acinetobacter sp. T_3_1]TCB67342.1 hypothetical protein E0H88_12495 [Acinetobacter sp. ANC 4216]